MADHLLYWKYETAVDRLGRGGLKYVASDQLGKVARGDCVWPVTFTKERHS